MDRLSNSIPTIIRKHKIYDNKQRTKKIYNKKFTYK